MSPEPADTRAQDPGRHGDADLLDLVAEQVAQQQAEPKPWWQSRTLIGAAIVLLAQIAPPLGVEIDAQSTAEAVSSAATLIGAALVWWGRMRATRPVRFRRPRPAGAAAGSAADGIAGTDHSQRLHAATDALPDHAAAAIDQPGRTPADIGRRHWLDH